MIKIFNLNNLKKEDVFERVKTEKDVSSIVKEILDDVKLRGDEALFFYNKKFDNAVIDQLLVQKEEIDEALKLVDEKFLSILKEASKNIREFHEKQKRQGFKIEKENGAIIGQKIIPIAVAGLYVPGGTASYPSTVLMDAIPAKIAGCKKVVMVTPPNKEGKIAPEILAAAFVAGVDTIFKVGGAQAIGALAYGTKSIPKADKIVGPGNAFVAEAKRQVFGKVSIDMIAGPSEILVIADKNQNPKFVAADLLSQAEHDKMATAVLITDSIDLAKEVQQEVERQLEKLPRQEIARASIENNGKIILCEDIEKAIALSNELAPEHLEICVDNALDYIDKVENAGSVFLGRYCPEALGDYMAGTNHTLPTSGTAKFSSPLSVDDFVKKTQFTFFTKQAFEGLAPSVAYFAEKEGLSAHARSATIRLEEKE